MSAKPVVLVANRGEIAARVIAACRRIGAVPVLAASSVDADSPAARLADRVVVIGPAPAQKSYLVAERIAQAAKHAGADIVHPGYGFLSEQPALPRLLAAENIGWAGPDPETLERVGDKASAREIASRAGVPVAPGRTLASLSNLAGIAADVGYPLLVKAVHGGGGRGIQRIDDRETLLRVAPIAQAEAHAAFGNGEIYLERFYPAARHVEVQVFGDGAGKVWILGDRDCSVQRRYQKLIEECPAPGLSAATRNRLHESAAALVHALRYRGAGTVEFIVDATSGEAVFLEVNARIQVEHPVTEEAYGIDLVKAQLLLALGRDPELPDVAPTPPLTAMEVRVNAEDPFTGFRPQPGTIGAIRWPRGPGIRIETVIEPGYVFQPYYDSLLAKLAVRAHDRTAALAALLSAVRQTHIEGVSTTLPMHEFVLSHPDFARGGVTTAWFAPEWERCLEGGMERVA